MARKPWGGRFPRRTDPAVEAFTASLHVDRELATYDIQGSMAHCRMLARQKILSAAEARTLLRGLEEVQREIDQGNFPYRPELEDIHMNIEQRLTELVGEVGGKLHTARSRNDQVALDTRLYLRDRIDGIRAALRGLIRALAAKARSEIDRVMPGFTHLQIAQPVLLAHHLLAYCEMLLRDRERLADCRKRVDVLPLGSAALAGTSFPIDRRAVARELGFSRISENSMDAVADRDFVIEFLACASLIMVHLSRFCEDLILWVSPAWGFAEIGDAFCTGSSIMPQKKNPDVPELVRGKAGRVFGRLMALLTTLKGLPMTYNRDLQEDKEALFDAVETVTSSLEVLARLVPTLTFRSDRMEAMAREGYSTATDLADYLVRKGLPFRRAHEVTGRIVRHCLDHGKELSVLKLEELRRFWEGVEPDVYAVLDPRRSVASRDLPGGTARRRVQARLRRIERLTAGSGTERSRRTSHS